MFIITALVQPQKFEDVKKALFEADVHKMTVTSAKGCGQQKGYDESFRGVHSEIVLRNKLQIEIAVNQEFLEPTIDAIIKGARTGNIGDGKIFVTELKECVRIRTGERGQDAIG
ncbi:P-II family nitrogen regulator [Oceanispirochaeta crateris]|jgi:nitrogen regulatory protein P-II 1|uniref:P-II family nitrogen regulator n=1 Tax=Oceanispirochaeta crateris TaxID=2518645 RepID=A0A5C1QHL3_9SPIO|nr:P-II family nitrogen regulator [Oceanispirochaeta crateris]QEN06480.1 P-II family nitrogen regulator [Oceanispirochaeta crateris]